MVGRSTADASVTDKKLKFALLTLGLGWIVYLFKPNNYEFEWTIEGFVPLSDHLCHSIIFVNLYIGGLNLNLLDVLLEAVKSNHVLSLYRGLGSKSLQSFIAHFVYFYGYSYFKRVYLEKSGAKSIGTKANLIIAAAAGACTVFITQPLDTASSRMQTSVFGKSKGLWKTLTEGDLSDAYDGLGISLLLTSNPAIQYTVFDQLRQRLLQRKGIEQGSSPQTLSAFSAFMLGAISKSIATCVTYPAVRCKVMIQAAGTDDDKTKKMRKKSCKTMGSVLRSIWKNEGGAGFFKGLHAQILKTVLSSALLQ